MRVEINGIGLHYIDTGKRNGLPMLFLHGMTFDHTMWSPQIELLKSKRRVIALDLRGHGKSGVGDGQYTFRMFSEDLVALMDYLEIDKAALCGLSMGGAIALRTVELYPERVGALIFCDATCHADSDEARKRRESAIQTIKKDGLGSFADGFLRMVFTPETFSNKMEIVESMRKVIVSSSPLGICGALLAQAARTDTSEILSKIAVPTLLIVGEQDSITPPALFRSIHERVSESELRVIPNAAHVTNLENRQEFNKRLMDFMNRIE